MYIIAEKPYQHPIHKVNLIKLNVRMIAGTPTLWIGNYLTRWQAIGVYVLVEGHYTLAEIPPQFRVPYERLFKSRLETLLEFRIRICGMCFRFTASSFNAQPRMQTNIINVKNRVTMS